MSRLLTSVPVWRQLRAISSRLAHTVHNTFWRSSGTSSLRYAAVRALATLASRLCKNCWASPRESERAALASEAGNRWAKKKRRRYNAPVGRCRVSHTDTEGISHTVHVDAESLFEAVRLAVAEFRDDKTVEHEPGSHTEFTVHVLRQPIEHRVRLKKVQEWSQPSVRGGPAEMMRRDRVRKTLGQ